MRRQVLVAHFLFGTLACAPIAEAWVGPATGPRTSRSGTSLLRGGDSSSVDVASVDVAPASLVETEAPQQATARWVRGLLAACAVFAAVAAGASRPVRAEGDSVSVYFGQGCFWHVQHEFVKKEAQALGRDAKTFTALSGYAGGTEVGDRGRVCYHNMANAPDYGRMGHAEAVGLSVPKDKVYDFAKMYIDAGAKFPFGRADPQDRGGEYRSVIGIPGGVDGPLFKQVSDANEGRMKLVAGKGNDPDTVGSKTVYVYDSAKFPFYQGEVYHQFHDDMMERYTSQYHDIKDVMVKSGALKSVECPEFGF